MDERPILFNTEMVRAILDGQKTQSRRVIKPQPDEEKFSGMINDGRFARFWSPGEYIHTSTITDVRCPYGVPGDRLWVRETWQTTKFFVRSDGTSPIAYLATDADPATGFGPYDHNWQSPIFMPRWASRITLEILAVRVERVRDISSHDAFLEGIDPDVELLRQSLATKSRKIGIDMYHKAHTIPFSALWDSINAKSGYGWDADPWVWVVEFKKLA